MTGLPSQVWVAGQDGRALIRADAIVAVDNGHGGVTVQVSGLGEHDVLLAVSTDDAAVPDDFHRQLIRAVAEAADAGGAQLIQASCDDGWRWATGPV